MTFGRRPKLIVTFLKSYESFGRVLWWIGNGSQPSREALARWSTQQAFIAKCEQSKGDSIFSNACHMYRSGLLPTPQLLDGTWTDHSSQASAVGFASDYMEYDDRCVRLSQGRCEHSRVYLPTVNAPIARPGTHRVSFAHLMDDARPLFKLLSVHSC